MRNLMFGLGLCLLASGCNMPRFDYTRTVEESIDVQPSTVVDLSTFNGAISVVGHTEPTVEMQITFKAFGESEAAAQSNCEQLAYEAIDESGRLVIKATKPAGHYMSSAAFELKVPRSCQLKLHTSNGTVSTQDMLASVEVDTSNGTIHLKRVEDAVIAKTSNGKISLEDCQGSVNLSTSNGTVTYSGRLVGVDNTIRTSNGRVSIELANDIPIEVSSSTSNGSITCSVPTQSVLEQSKSKFHAILGENGASGTNKLNVQTSNGSVKIAPLHSDKDRTEP